MKEQRINFLAIFLAVIITTIISVKNTHASEGDVWLTPVVQSVKPSTNFDVEVHVDTGTKDLASFNLDFNFDATKTTIDTTKGDNGVDKGTSEYIITPNANNIASGQYILGGINAAGISGNDIHIATIHAKTMDGFTSGTTSLSIQLNDALKDHGGLALTTGTITGGTVAALAPVYRFWSDTKQGHFYTISEAEKNNVIATYPSDVWNYEGIAFYANTASTSINSPVYRFWSDTKQGHFYTISEAEKNNVIATYPSDVWNYEWVAFYTFP